MKRRVLKNIKETTLAVPQQVGWHFTRNLYTSVYFYTLHKCASTLFAGYLLRHVEVLRLLNYAAQIYRGRHVDVVFKPKGYVIGPIRISADPLSGVYDLLVRPACRPEFIRDKTALFLIRDPRDILVSSYYSFGYTHGFSSVHKIRERQELAREKIQKMTIDEYVLSFADQTLYNFETIWDLNSACERSIVLRYEDMISDFEYFATGLTKFLKINKRVLKRLREASRPRSQEDLSSHRRSGQPEGFRSKLSDQTIDILNNKFESILEHFKYKK